MKKVIIEKNNQSWTLEFKGGRWVISREGDSELSGLLEKIRKGIVLRTVVVKEGTTGHGIRLITDVNDPDYLVGLRAMLFENGYTIKEAEE